MWAPSIPISKGRSADSTSRYLLGIASFAKPPLASNRNQLYIQDHGGYECLIKSEKSDHMIADNSEHS